MRIIFTENHQIFDNSNGVVNNNIYNLIDENGNVTQIEKNIINHEVISNDYINVIILDEESNIKSISDYINTLKKINSTLE